MAARAHPGNPDDWPTLKSSLEQVQELTGTDPVQMLVDLGYRGHGYVEPVIVNVDKRRPPDTQDYLALDEAACA